ncbi:unnamed protein product [Acanthoscelides obtectus]|uniref:Dynein regulatory complex protein 10 n=1 Tax=Acanthoscelides obtectus TaxID=200917 RepID=A0A9P0K0A8_ACAOB|nr:unnamed protein product [Acanthoscelides obtectus]CAK1647212.1 hypothetical protein AOBTE_LOCUS15112 [Acanthoscelides obtectus]
MADDMVVKRPKKLMYSLLAEIEMDEESVEIVDKYKDRKLTPMELDLKLHADRVMYVLNRTLAKLQVMAHLPMFLYNDAELLKKYSNKKDQYFILQTMNSFGASFDLSKYDLACAEEYMNINELMTPNTKSQRQKKCVMDQLDLESKTDPAVAKMIDVLFYNKCIVAAARAAKTSKIDKFLAHFTNILNEFKDIVKKKLYVTGDEENARDKELRRTYKTNLMLLATMEDLQERIEAQRKDLGGQVNQKVEVFEMYNKKMEAIREDFLMQMKKFMVDNEKAMMKKVNESEENQICLSEEASRLTKQYETLLEDHLIEEKQARSRRYKMETQLQNWVVKFDQDIGEKQAELDRLQKEYDDKKEEMDGLEDLLAEQEEEYTTLMKEKYEEEERIFNEMAWQFLINRSARRIQRYWRAHRERKLARKKGRRGKGKGTKTKPSQR